MAAYGSTAVLLEESESSDSSSGSERLRQRSFSGDDRKRPVPNRGLRFERNILDSIGFQELGISDFSHKLRKLLKVEGDTAALKELESSK